LLKMLTPVEYHQSIYEIDFERLRARGIRGLIFDLDNTLVEWQGMTPGGDLAAFLERIRRLGFEVCIVSNNHPERVEGFSLKFGIPSIGNAGKPRRRAFRAALELLGTSVHQTAVIGDQVFTDILGGNRLGLYTILVVPINKREFIGTRLVRRLERWVLKRVRPQGGS